MASLDKLEGDAVEAVGLALLAALLYVAWLAYKGVNGFHLPTLQELLAKLKAALADMFTPSAGGAGSAQVYTGNTSGSEDAQTWIKQMIDAGENPRDYVSAIYPGGAPPDVQAALDAIDGGNNG